MNVKRPRPLLAGDTVGFISPSAPIAHIAPNRVERCLNWFRMSGFKVLLSPNALASTGYVSADAMSRAADINEMYANDEVTAIVSLIGGYHCNQLLPFLDFDLIGRHPKILTGFSDLVVLQTAIWTETRTVTFYGPAGLSQFGEYPSPLEFSLHNFFKVVENAEAPGRLPSSAICFDELLDWTTNADEIQGRLEIHDKPRFILRQGSVEGQLLGGCLPSLLHLRGTRFWPDLTGAILFLEIPELTPSDPVQWPSLVDMYLADLEISGVFDLIGGILFGRTCRSTPSSDAAIFDLLLKYTAKRPIPIIANFECGHTDPILTLPLGCQVRIGGRSADVFILEGGVER